MVDLCQTILPVITNPKFLAGGAGLGITAKILYSYSSLTFWPSILSASAIWRTLMTTISAAGSLLRTDLLKYVATATTFSQTLTYILTGDIQILKLVKTPFKELGGKIAGSVPNFVEGLSLITEWVSTLGKQGVCGLTSNMSLFWNGLVSIWIGTAAVLFVLWIWEKMWYDWRNVQMESQEQYLIVGLVVLASVSVHSTAVVAEAVSNGKSLADTLAQALGDFGLDPGSLNGTGNETVNGTDNITK